MKEAVQILFKKKANQERFMKFITDIGGDKDEIRYLVYEIVSEFLYVNNIQSLMEQVRRKEIGFNHPSFDTIRNEFQEQDDFFENPPQVEEGIMECKRCRSKRTFSFSKQTRRSDESATVFIRCSNCDFMYKI
jgi:DNA-directed RNA polymerase subunit M/transcription elongation factor TFIIS